jgi:hypothetical protein
MRAAFSLIFLLIFLAAPVIAQQSTDLQNYLSSFFNTDTLANFLLPNLPPEYLRIPEIIWYVIVPFIAVYAVIYGFLQELKLFRYTSNKVNIVLAFAMTMLLLPSGVLTFIIVQLYSFGAAFAAIIFGIVFIVGVFMWMIASGYRFWGTVNIERTYVKSINNLSKDVYRLRVQRKLIYDQITRETNPKRIAALTQNMAAIEGQIAQLEERIQAIRRAR